MARPRQALLTRERIVEAATALIDAEGLEAVSTRRLAAELGVAGPSLYNHFRTKDDILAAVADEVIADLDLSVLAGPDWREAMFAWARAYRAALADHPNIVAYMVTSRFASRPVPLRMADELYGALVSAGWPPSWATRIAVILRYLVTGSSLGSFASGFSDGAETYSADRYPHLTEAAYLLPKHRYLVDERAFELGLRILLDGLALVHLAMAPSPGTEDAGSPGSAGH
jgi:AcrR family transcriptional regulator